MQRIVFDPNHAALRADRNRALAALDLAWGRRMFPGALDADILVAMHKARYHSTDVPRELRHQSAQWLKDGGHTDALGEPIMAEGWLPR